MRIKRIILLTLTAVLPVLAEAQDIIVTDSTDTADIVNESSLSFPNAFSPNGDQINDVYKAKEHTNIVEFHAYIFNRWGQKLFEWTDPDEGWDGTYKGKDVSQGTYYVLVKARGADERRYTIRKDVNLLRGFSEGTLVTQ